MVGKGFLGGSLAVNAALSWEPLHVIMALAVGILQLSQSITNLLQPKSTVSYFGIKVLTTATSATISAVAFATLFSLPLTGATVALYAGLIASLSIVEMAVELGILYFKTPTTELEIVSMAENLLQGSHSSQVKAFQLLDSTQGKGYVDCLNLLSRCYREGLGVDKNSETAQILSLKAQCIVRVGDRFREKVEKILTGGLPIFVHHHHQISFLKLMVQIPLDEMNYLVGREAGALTNPYHPFQIYRRHLEERDRKYKVKPPRSFCYSKPVALNPDGIRVLKKKKTFADLPRGIGLDTFEKLIDKVRTRLQKHPDRPLINSYIETAYTEERPNPDWVPGSDDPLFIPKKYSLYKLFGALEEHPLAFSLLREKGPDDQPISDVKYQLHQILHWIAQLPDTPKALTEEQKRDLKRTLYTGENTSLTPEQAESNVRRQNAIGALLSPQEEALLGLGRALEKCNRGRTDALQDYYNQIASPDDYFGPNAIVDPIEATKVYFSRLVQEFFRMNISSPSALMQFLTSPSIPEILNVENSTPHLVYLDEDVPKNTPLFLSAEITSIALCSGATNGLSERTQDALKKYLHLLYDNPSSQNLQLPYVVRYHPDYQDFLQLQQRPLSERERFEFDFYQLHSSFESGRLPKYVRERKPREIYELVHQSTYVRNRLAKPLGLGEEPDLDYYAGATLGPSRSGLFNTLITFFSTEDLLRLFYEYVKPKDLVKWVTARVNADMARQQFVEVSGLMMVGVNETIGDRYTEEEWAKMVEVSPSHAFEVREENVKPCWDKSRVLVTKEGETVEIDEDYKLKEGEKEIERYSLQEQTVCELLIKLGLLTPS